VAGGVASDDQGEVRAASPSIRAGRAVLRALRAGEVPAAVGRALSRTQPEAVDALEVDLSRVARGGGVLRLLTGPPAGAQGLLVDLTLALAAEARFLTGRLPVELALAGGTAPLEALAASLRLWAAPDAPALPRLVARLRAAAQADARARGGDADGLLRRRLLPLLDLPGGEDWGAALVLASRAPGVAEAGEALAWLTGEIPRGGPVGLSPRSDSGTPWLRLRLLARTARLAGYAGLAVALDGLDRLPARRAARRAAWDRLIALRAALAGVGTHGLGVFGAAGAPFRDAAPEEASGWWAGGGPARDVPPLGSEERLALVDALAALVGTAVSAPVRQALARVEDPGRMLREAAEVIDAG